MEYTIDISGKDYALEYLAEGAANVVYKLHPRHPDLLRLRKTRSSILYAEVVHSFETIVAPLFPNDALLHPRLLKLPDAETLIPRLSMALREKEGDGSRSEMRRGVYLATDEENGMLVQDMTPRHEKENFIEFKPKWLIQSPSAPANAKRCRTCALREMRRAVKGFSGRGDAGFCPLDLLSNTDDRLDDILGSLVGDELELAKAIFKSKVQQLLIRLRTLQIQHNRVGLADLNNEHISVSSHAEVDRSQERSAASLMFDTLLGMIVRDCSVFIRYNSDNSEVDADVKLADLDMKSAKIEKWADTERQLIDGGWYTGTEDGAEEHGRRFCRALEII